MIAEKMLPTTYVIEAEGKAASAILPFARGLDRISFISTNYDTDISAISGLNLAMSSMCNLVDTKDASEQMTFNPEFFPSYADTLDDNQKEAAAFNETVIANAKFEVNTNSGADKIDLSFVPVFDELGDFVEMKWVVESSELLIEARIIASPDDWMREKLTESRMRIMSTTPQQKMCVH